MSKEKTKVCKHCKEEIEHYLAKIGLELNEKKTKNDIVNITHQSHFITKAFFDQETIMHYFFLSTGL